MRAAGAESVRCIAEELNRRAILTARGAAWARHLRGAAAAAADGVARGALVERSGCTRAMIESRPGGRPPPWYDLRPSMGPMPRFKTALCFIVCTVLFAVYAAIYLPFLPTPYSTVGHDYSLHLPNFLTGYYWYLQNGLWTTPWFSPSQCGGFPFFADPNVIYFSLTQLLVLTVSPMRAIQLTFLLFALIGMVGAFLLMRRSFQSSHTAATVAAALFLFNGFFAYRVLIGHLTFHAFALVPLMTAAILPAPRDHRLLRLDLGTRVCVVALCLAYMFQSGMVHGIPPALIAVVAIILIHALCFGWRLTPFVLLACAGLLSLALCADRLAAELALLSNFPRDNYLLPGFAGVGFGLWNVFRILFFDVSTQLPELSNVQWILDRHEWEHGVSAAPLLIFAVWAFAALSGPCGGAPASNSLRSACSAIQRSSRCW